MVLSIMYDECWGICTSSFGPFEAKKGEKYMCDNWGNCMEIYMWAIGKLYEKSWVEFIFSRFWFFKLRIA